MALNKHWILNENYQPLFKIDFDNTSSDYFYLWSLNGGIAYGVKNPVIPSDPYSGSTPFLVKKITEPLSDFRVKINSIILGTYNKTGISAQDNQVSYLSSWDDKLCNFFCGNEQFPREGGEINYCLPYGIGDASKGSNGYWGIDYKVKPSEYYSILKHIKDDVTLFQRNCISYVEGEYENCLYIGHIGGLYEYLNQYNTDFNLNTELITTKSGGGRCIPILWWNCVSDGLGRLNAISGATNTNTNISNTYFRKKLCLYYNKSSGMCVFLFLSSGLVINTTQRFNIFKNFLSRFVELQASVGYIVVPPTH